MKNRFCASLPQSARRPRYSTVRRAQAVWLAPFRAAGVRLRRFGAGQPGLDQGDDGSLFGLERVQVLHPLLLGAQAQRFHNGAVKVGLDHCRVDIALATNGGRVAQLFATASMARTMFFLAGVSESKRSNSRKARIACAPWQRARSPAGARSRPCKLTHRSRPGK